MGILKNKTPTSACVLLFEMCLVVNVFHSSEYVWSFYKCISSGAQHVTVQKYLLFSNPAHKTKIRTADRWETTNSKPPVPISQSDVRPCCGFYQPQQTVQKCWVKTILLSQTGILYFFSSNFNSQRHILITGGVAQ
jgi:hypothetical protein